MPTYDYLCKGCGHRFEELQSFSEEPLTKCPACKKKKLERLFGTGAAVLFKGSGFYETDYRSESYKADAKKESEAGKTPAAGTTGATPATGTTPATSTTDSSGSSSTNSTGSSGGGNNGSTSSG